MPRLVVHPLGDPAVSQVYDGILAPFPSFGLKVLGQLVVGQSRFLFRPVRLYTALMLAA